MGDWEEEWAVEVAEPEELDDWEDELVTDELEDCEVPSSLEYTNSLQR